MAKVLRDIIIIDEDLCDGCGDCITSCAEGALEIVDGKARLRGEVLCDGAGACIGHCPTGALTVEKRESEEYDEAVVQAELKAAAAKASPAAIPMAAPSGCPGSAARQWNDGPQQIQCEVSRDPAFKASTEKRRSELRQWPVQLTLVPPNAPYFKNANLVIAADCVPFAYPEFHNDFLKGKALVVGCPKLDDLQSYVAKLTEVFGANDIKSVEVLLMEVPCCGGIVQAARMARDQAGASFSVRATVIGVQGTNLGSQEF
ncbi:MAG: 4Fe-4S ferredoxin [bacterium]|nr:4Fe-4S ferredoxin [bacterium]